MGFGYLSRFSSWREKRVEEEEEEVEEEMRA
jgi:hypothetical protein